MAGGHGGGDYKDLVVFLAAAGVVVPLFNRWKISPVLGFLAAGVLLGCEDDLSGFDPSVHPVVAAAARELGWLRIGRTGAVMAGRRAIIGVPQDRTAGPFCRSPAILPSSS